MLFTQYALYSIAAVLLIALVWLSCGRQGPAGPQQKGLAKPAVGGEIRLGPSTATGGEVIPGHYIVVLRAGVSPASVTRSHGLAAEHVYDAALNGFAGAIPEARLAAVRNDPRVASVEADRTVVAFLHENPFETLTSGIDRIDAEANGRTDVSGVGIAIIDTGIWLTHADLNVAGNVTFVRGTKSGNDDHGHGTHVAGIAAAKTNDSRGVRGVAPNARLYAVKVLNRNGSGTASQLISGVDWVTKNAAAKGIQVANMSLGFGEGVTITALNTAISNSVAAGITYAVAAGNSSKDASLFSPANHPDVITVSAMGDSDGQCGGAGGSTSYGPDDTFASFSNFGATVEIAAPGVDIVSTYKDGMYATISGTSMASPHVAGAAAQYIASNPGASPAAVRGALIAAGTPQGQACGVDGTGRTRGGFTGDPDGSPEPLTDAGGL